jgi:hypothetical protein
VAEVAELSDLADVAVLRYYATMPIRRPPRRLVLRLAPALRVQLAAEAARTGQTVRELLPTLLAEGVALYTARFGGRSPAPSAPRPKRPRSAAGTRDR